MVQQAEMGAAVPTTAERVRDLRREVADPQVVEKAKRRRFGQERMTVLVRELGEGVGVTRACTALGVPRPSYYRRCSPARRRAERKRPPPPRALGPSEQQELIEVLHSERFVDQAPAQVVASLLQEGIYHCSARTMYRILSARGEVRERRNQLVHPRYQRPELLATGPNQVWTWDITKLAVWINPPEDKSRSEIKLH